MKRRTYLELGRRTMFGRPVKKPVGPVEPPPDPQAVADFDLGTWRVRPALGRMTRADRIVALDENTLVTLLCLVEAPPEGVNRDELALRVFGHGEHEPKLRRCMSFLRRVFSEDGSVRVENAPGDCYALAVGEAVPGRTLRPSDGAAMVPSPAGVDQWLGRKRRRWTAGLAAAAIVAAIGTSLVLLLDRGKTVTLGEVQDTVTLAAEPGAERNPSFAPDGRQFVYSWQPEGAQFAKLWIRSVGGATPRALTQGIRDDLYPAWSPSGNLVAFMRVDGPQCEVWVTRPDASDEARIGECSVDALGPLEWTADGNAVTYAFRTAPVLPTQLVSVAVADQKMIGVTNPVIGQPGDSWPTLASNGRRLVFQRSRSVGVADLLLIESATGEPGRVTRDGVETFGSAFEPGNRTLVFASPRGGRSALWRTMLDGRLPQQLVARDRADLRAPVISNDGRQLAYERWRTQTRLLAVPLSDDLEQAPSTWLAPDPAGALDRDPQLSPDRSRLAFVSDRSGRDQLWLADATGSEPRRLTDLELDYLQSPRWSPDGRSLVLAAAQRGEFGLWLVDVADGRARRIDTPRAAHSPSFARDGQWLYYASNETGQWQIWRREWPEGAPQQVTAEGGFAAVEARDGSALYYVRADRNGLWRRTREPGGDDVLVTPELNAADWNNFHVTEDAIYFVARPDRENAQLSRYSLLDEQVTRIRPLPGLLPRSGLTLSGDGRSMVVAQVARADVDIEMVTLE
jgi:Tol biopolymer transport system component/DNA-binding winged helix-turn-helix (wHTH) protein